MSYRIKTKEEFISQYGADFCDKTKRRWVDRMNYLFGRKLTKKQSNILASCGYTSVDGWNISDDMVTEELLKNEEENRSFALILHYKIMGNTVEVALGKYKATAKCHPDDKFDFQIGMAVALTRLARQLGEYEAEEEVVIKKIVKRNIVDEI